MPPTDHCLVNSWWEISNFGDIQLRGKHLTFVGKDRKKKWRCIVSIFYRKKYIYLFLWKKNYYHCSYDPAKHFALTASREFSKIRCLFTMCFKFPQCLQCNILIQGTAYQKLDDLAHLFCRLMPAALPNSNHHQPPHSYVILDIPKQIFLFSPSCPLCMIMPLSLLNPQTHIQDILG